MTKYVKHLNDLLLQNVYNFFNKLYETSTPKGKNFLKSFQKNLENSDNYSNEKILKLTENINVKYTQKLLLKILMEESESKNPELFLKVSFEDFIGNLLLNCRKDIWNNPNLFYTEGIETYKIQKNKNQIMNLIKENINKTIRFFIPYDLLLSNELEELNLNQVSEEEYFSEDSMVSEKNEEEDVSEDDVLFDDLEE